MLETPATLTLDASRFAHRSNFGANQNQPYGAQRNQASVSEPG